MVRQQLAAYNEITARARCEHCESGWSNVSDGYGMLKKTHTSFKEVSDATLNCYCVLNTAHKRVRQKLKQRI